MRVVCLQCDETAAIVAFGQISISLIFAPFMMVPLSIFCWLLLCVHKILSLAMNAPQDHPGY